MADHNNKRVDLQGPTKKDLSAPVIFRRRVSLPNHIFLHLPFHLPFYHWLALYQMAGPSRTTPATGSARHEEYKPQPPRPRNAWILYRSYKLAMFRETSERLSQAEVSKRVASMWKNEIEPVKQYFEQLAEAEKLKHQQLYPDYRFCPQKKEDKLRAKEVMKQNRRAKRYKTRNATPPNANANASAAPSAVSLPSMPRPYFMPPNMALPQPYVFPYAPEAHYGPRGPSPPISAAPSPAPCEASQSPRSDENVTSSSSTPSIPSSTSSSSRASSSSSQLSANQFYTLPSSHHPSPNAYATQSLPTLLFQSSPHSQQSLTPSQAQTPSPVDNAVPAAAMWSNIYSQLPNIGSQNNTELVNYDVPTDQVQDFIEFQQGVSGISSSHSLLPATNANSAFNLSHINNSNLVVPPRGELNVAMGARAPIVDYNGQLFTDHDLVEFQNEMASLAEAGLSSQAISSSLQEDIESLFRPPNVPGVEGYAAAHQRQPSVFAQDMMDLINFEAAAGLAEANSPATSTLPTTVAPQQVRLENTQQAAAMPIFTQMTNTQTVASGSSYVPPPGAIYSSTRRVGGSWKPSFVTPSQTEDPVQAWTLSTN